MYTHYVEATDGKGITTFTRKKVGEKSESQLGTGDALATYGFVFSEFSKVLGKVLTLIDASMAEPRQNKAFKDIVKNVFADEYGFLSEMLLDQSVIEKSAEIAWDNGTLEPVDLDQVIKG